MKNWNCIVLNGIPYSFFNHMPHATYQCIQIIFGQLFLGLHERFYGIFSRLGIHHTGTHSDQHASKHLLFNDEIFILATALDPTYAFQWLMDHPGTDQEKEELRQRTIGE
jgi:hypothetical protein